MTREADSAWRRIWLEVEGLSIRCLAAGVAGPPVLPLHGGGIDSASFSYKYAIEPLARKHRVFAPDWPGYGESDKPDIGYTIEYYVDFLGHLMEALELERASLAGISMGGGVALGFALSSPHRVEKLVLVDSYGLGSEVPLGRLGYLLVRAPLLNRMMWALLRRSREMVRCSLYNVVHDRRVVTEEMIEESYELYEQPGAGRAFRSLMRNEVGWSGLHTNFAEQLHEIKPPTLIVHGEHDRVVPIAWARRAHERIPHSELRVLSGCGRITPRECPTEFNRIVEQFLAR